MTNDTEAMATERQLVDMIVDIIGNHDHSHGNGRNILLRGKYNFVRGDVCVEVEYDRLIKHAVTEVKVHTRQKRRWYHVLTGTYPRPNTFECELSREHLKLITEAVNKHIDRFDEEYERKKEAERTIKNGQAISEIIHKAGK